jgi:23S rRNA pseudouridine2605 synthase
MNKRPRRPTGETRNSNSDKPKYAKNSTGKPAGKRDFNKSDGDKKYSKPSGGSKSYDKRGSDKKEFGKSDYEKKSYGKSGDKTEFRSSDYSSSPSRSSHSKPGGKRDFDKPKFDKPRGEKRDFDKPKFDKPRGEKRDFDKPREDRYSDSRGKYGKPAGNRDFGDKPRGEKRDFDKPRGDKRDFDKPRGERKDFDKPRGEKRDFDKPREERTYSSDSKRKFDTPRGGYNDKREFSDKPKFNKPRGEKRDFPEKKFDKPKPRFHKEVEEGEAPKDFRLNRFISNSGICSRREADQLIADGKITVNKIVVTEMGYRVAPKDVVRYDGNVLTSEKLQYVLLNKPKGFITTMKDDRDRKTVMSLIEKACEERIYPVGRLDRHTTGLLLFTNDGDLAKKLTHPSHNMKKIYQVELDKGITQAHFDEIINGFELEDGPIKVDDLAVITPDNITLGIELHSGKNRIIRRIFEHFGYTVEKLDRVMLGNLTKKNLGRSEWRHLTPREVSRL